MTESIDFEYAAIVIKNGVMECTFKKRNEVDLEIAKILVKKRIKYSNGISYPCLFDITQIKHSSKEARDFLATDGNELVTASALLINSPMIKMAANFYIAVNKPLKPTRLFTVKREALEWLKQFKG